MNPAGPIVGSIAALKVAIILAVLGVPGSIVLAAALGLGLTIAVVGARVH